MDISIKKINKEDLSAIKTLKLNAVKESPLAFDTSFEEANAWSGEKWEERLKIATDITKEIFFIAWDNDKPVGYIQIYLNQKLKKRHIAEFDTLHILPNYRRKGIAEKLFQTVLDEIKSSYPEIVKIELSVYESQTAALAFYEKLGFMVFGEFDKGLLVEGNFYKQYMMDLFLK